MVTRCWRHSLEHAVSHAACLKLRRRVNNCTYLGHRLSARFHMATSSRITTQDETGANLAHTLTRAHTHAHARAHWSTSVASTQTHQRLFAGSALVAQNRRSGRRDGMWKRCKFLRGTVLAAQRQCGGSSARPSPPVSPCPLGHCT